MKKFSLALLGLIIIFSFDAVAGKGGNGNGNSNGYITYSDSEGDFEDTSVWQNENVPSDFVNIDKEMTINGTVTRNGDLNPVTVEVNGTFYVKGNYENNQWDGLKITRDAKVEVFGNLNASQAITIEQGGILIVHGDLISTNAGLHIKGDLIVKGDFSTSSGTQVNNSGNLIVGGDFSHLGGGLNAQSDDVYILNPDATIISPGWGIINDGDYGTLDNFINDESGSDLGNLVDEVGLLNPVVEWMGTVSADWSNANNWKNNQVPDYSTSVKVSPSSNAPAISGNAVCKELTIENGAEVVLNPGASLDVANSFTNNGLVVLRSTPEAVSSLNVPENNTDSGRGRVELSEVKANQWYRLGVPVSDGSGVMLDASESTNWVYRSAKSWKRITTDSEPVAPMEGIMVLYEADHVIDFEGTLNTGEITRTINYGKGYYLFSNPYPSAMKWDISNPNSGVTVSDNVSSTIYYRVYAGSQVGDYMITYNGFSGMSTVVDGGNFPGGYTEENIGEIAPMQSVWVKVNNSEEATITVNNKARIKENTMPLKSTSSFSSERSVLRLMQTNEFVSDVTVLSFDDVFADGLDRADSEKMFNGSKNVPEIYTRVEGKSLSINGMSALNGAPMSIPVSVRNGIESEVTLSWDLAEFTDNYNVFLEDRATGSWINLREVADYTYTPEKMGDNHDRFVLHLEKMQEVATSVATVDSENVESIEVVGNNNNVIVRISAELLGSNDATIEVVDLNGRVIENVKTRATETQISLPAGTAVYVIKVIAEDAQKVAKVAGR
jgi:hypothetical protein